METIVGAVVGFGLLLWLLVNLIPLLIAGVWAMAVSRIAKANNAPHRGMIEVLLLVGFVSILFVSILGFIPIIVAHVMASSRGPEKPPEEPSGRELVRAHEREQARLQRAQERIRRMQAENRGERVPPERPECRDSVELRRIRARRRALRG